MQRYYYNGIGKCSFAVLSLLIILLVASCHKEDFEITPADEGEVTLTFSAKVPMASSGVRTYALGDAQETELRDVDVLIYTKDGAEWKFHQRTVGKIGSVTTTGNGGGTVDIEVTLLKTKVESRLVIIANAREQLNAYPFITGELLTVLQENLVYELGEGERWLVDPGTEDGYTPLPMWGEYNIVDGIDGGTGTLPGSVDLLRSVARVDVQITENALGKFTLDSVFVYNSNRNGLIIPSGDLTKPSLPTVLYTNSDDALGYAVADGIGLVGEMYLFEAKAGSGDGSLPVLDLGATALVIKGRFDGISTPYYYRIDFRDAGNTKLIPLLRNTRYKINIKDADINTGGASDRREAFEETASLPNFSSFVSSGGFIGRSGVRKQNDGITFKGNGINYTVIATNEGM